jgi:hypothetical protein
MTASASEIKYRVQIPLDLQWSEWRSLDEPSPEPLILSLQLSEEVSWERYNREIAPKLSAMLEGDV